MGKRWTKQEEETLERLYGKATRVGLMTAFPGRSWQAIRAHAGILDLTIITEWSAKEDALLRRMYPSLPWKDLLKAFPRRTRASITHRASDIKISRPHGPPLGKRKNLDHRIAFLRLERLRQGKTQTQVAQKVGVHINDLCRWERGSGYPKFINFINWSQALGCCILVEQEVKPKSQPFPEILTEGISNGSRQIGSRSS